MGPHPNAINVLPPRPKFIWDPKPPPWTDGSGDQQAHKLEVELWKQFHYHLPANNSNKIPINLEGICLKSQLLCRAIDLSSGITPEQLSGENAVDLIINAIYKTDDLSVASEAYKVFNDLLKTKRDDMESMKNFELRFAAGVAKCNVIAESTKLPECLTALLVIFNPEITDSERVSVFAFASSSSDLDEDTETTNEEFLNSVSYSSVAPVVKQCERPNGRDLHGNSMYARGGYKNNDKNNLFRRRMTKEQNQAKTIKSPCVTCGKYGHWKNEHLEDDSLPANVKSVDKPSNVKPLQNYNYVSKNNGSGNSSKSNKTVSFNSATVTRKDETPVQCTVDVDDKHGKDCPFCEDWSLSDPKESVKFGSLDTSILSSNSAVLIGNMGNFNDCLHQSNGPLLDDSAPYSAIGEVELRILLHDLGLSFPKRFDLIPQSLSGYSFFQYGTGSHSSSSRKILGSVVLTAYSDKNRVVYITHIVLSGSSQWIVGRNVTGKADIMHIDRDALVFCTDESREKDSITLINDGFPSYIPIDRFTQIRNESSLSALSSMPVQNMSWNDTKHLIEKVHKHVCGHASFSDFKMLMERNNIWNYSVEDYVCQLINNCRSCKKSALPSPYRKVSISIHSKELN